MSLSQERSSSPDAANARAWIARAMQALRDDRADIAWLWADRLCRQTAGAARINALLLRSAIFARQGEQEAAQSDLRAAADIDPADLSVNRVLVNSSAPAERIAAARHLLNADAPEDRATALATLARAGFQCVGVLRPAGRRIALTLDWNGGAEITLDLRTDVGKRRVTVRASRSSAARAYHHSAVIAFDPPPGAEAATLASAELRTVMEPPVLLLPPQNRVHVAAANADGELLIVVPVYDDRAATRACFDSLLSNRPSNRPCRILAIDDASPDAGICDDLDALAARGEITLLRNPLNLGFARSVNRALALRSPNQDALLLNADVIIPPGAIEAMARHIKLNPDIGSATPLSNNGEDTSFPLRFRPNPLPPANTVAALDAAARLVNPGRAIDILNGVGFCLYVRGAALDRARFLPHAYGRGYYEDVDFCLALAKMGFRNVCASDVYVGHHGGRSFGSARRALVVRNRAHLSGRYPNYFKDAARFERTDPLRDAIGAIEFEQLRKRRAVDFLLAPSDAPRLTIDAVAAALGEADSAPIVARVERGASIFEISLTAIRGEAPQNIVWRFDADSGAIDEIARRFSALSLRSIFALDGAGDLSDVARALSRSGAKIHNLSSPTLTYSVASDQQRPGKVSGTSAFAAIDGKARRSDKRQARPVSLVIGDEPAWRTPDLRERCDTLAIIGQRTIDPVLLGALAGVTGDPSTFRILVIGRATPSIAATTIEAIHFSGAVDDAELPRWLERSRAGAVLFADRDWGSLDPRFRLWRDAGRRVAAFNDKATDAIYPHCLTLPRRASAAAIAGAITRWLREPRS
ncbi:MAG: glycosyltransferase family 2 protein [Rhizobiales bacterium]|nr:glycosyltransferase family 2 protein [Hyphomicrobiales bacterium]